MNGVLANEDPTAHYIEWFKNFPARLKCDLLASIDDFLSKFSQDLKIEKFSNLEKKTVKMY